MAVNKITSTIDGSIVHLFRVQCDAVSRKFAIGSSWTRIRLGVRFTMTHDLGAAVQYGVNSGEDNVDLAFGLQKSTGPTFGANTKTGGHYIALQVKFAAAERSDGPPVTFRSPYVDMCSVVSRHDATVDTATHAASSNCLRICASADQLQSLVLDVTRGASDWSAKAYYSTSSTPSHCTHAALDQAIQAADSVDLISALPSGHYELSAPVTAMTSRVALYGDFDEMFFFSQLPHYGLDVTDFMAYRMA